MTQCRYTKAYRMAGVSRSMYYFIYGRLLNINPHHKEFNTFVKKCCEAVALDEWMAVYEFITNPNINHVYICNKYYLNKNLLYSWKHKVYVMIYEAMKRGDV